MEDVSFTVPATGITALLGRNGVGKTSTIKAIIGLIDRTGAVELDGVRIEKEPTFKIIRSGVGYVPEDREVFSKLTVAENLRLAERDAAPAAPARRGALPGPAGPVRARWPAPSPAASSRWSRWPARC